MISHRRKRWDKLLRSDSVDLKLVSKGAVCEFAEIDQDQAQKLGGPNRATYQLL